MVVCLSSLLARADVVRRTGGFDRKLLYSQDSEFMFRLAMLTGFCYVNRPLVWFDRSPAEHRHVGVSADWNKMDFFLQDSQLRLEGLLRLSEGLPAKVGSSFGSSWARSTADGPIGIWRPDNTERRAKPCRKRRNWT